MERLPARLEGFIEGLCSASRVTFPYGGLKLSQVSLGDATGALPDFDSEPEQRVLEYFACAFGDTSSSSPQDAAPVVESLFSLIREEFPGSSVLTRINKRNGWFEDIEIWVNSSTERVYIVLDWSVS